MNKTLTRNKIKYVLTIIATLLLSLIVLLVKFVFFAFNLLLTYYGVGIQSWYHIVVGLIFTFASFILIVRLINELTHDIKNIKNNYQLEQIITRKVLSE